MRFLNFPSVLCIAACALLSFAAEAVRADGWMVQGPVVYRSFYAAAPATYYSACSSAYPQTTYYAPRLYAGQNYAPQTYSQAYSQQDHGSPQARVPRLPPQRPTTTAMVGALDNYFEPKTINVQPGTTIRWVNRGKHAHTVTADDDRWDSGDIAPGAAYSATFQRPGTYYYYCRHHADDKMRGTIVVESGGAYGGAGREGAATDARRGNGYGGRAPTTGGARTNGAGGGRSGY